MTLDELKARIDTQLVDQKYSIVTQKMLEESKVWVPGGKTMSQLAAEDHQNRFATIGMQGVFGDDKQYVFVKGVDAVLIFSKSDWLAAPIVETSIGKLNALEIIAEKFVAREASNIDAIRSWTDRLHSTIWGNRRPFFYSPYSPPRFAAIQEGSDVHKRLEGIFNCSKPAMITHDEGEHISFDIETKPIDSHFHYMGWDVAKFGADRAVIMSESEHDQSMLEYRTRVGEKRVGFEAIKELSNVLSLRNHGYYNLPVGTQFQLLPWEAEFTTRVFLRKTDEGLEHDPEEETWRLIMDSTGEIYAMRECWVVERCKTIE